MKNEFIPHQQGLQLKELGFDEPCWAWWHIEDCDIRYCYSDQRSPIINSRETEIVGLPTYSQAFRWFREKYKLYFSSHYSNLNYIGKWQWLITYEDNAKASDFVNTYEEVEQACLTKLIQIVKDGK